MKKLAFEGLFKNISSVDFFANWTIAKLLDSAEVGQKIYLADISKQLNIHMGKVTMIIKALEDRGLIQWNYDGKGDEGTYIIITAFGGDAVERRRHELEELHARVIDAFGEDKFLQWQELTAELEEVMNAEIKKMEVSL